MSVQDWILLLTAIGIVVERIIDRIKSSERNAKAIERNEATQEKVDTVAAKVEATETKVTQVAKVADATHTLVNSNMGIQLKVSAVAMRRVADLTRDDADKEAAAIAEQALAEHESKQAKVDRGETTPLAQPEKKR